MADTILDVDSLRRAVNGGARPSYRFFWGHKPRRDGALSDSCFSQWWPCQFVIDGQRYASAEQFMMAGKARLFGDTEALQRILATADPGRAKALGREVRDFVDETWTQARFDLVTRGNTAKFGQDERLRHYLLATRDQILVEASPVDRIWGIGLAADHEHVGQPEKWRGLNLLGFALMRTRAILRGELPPSDAGH
jgi:ribA/ribD-fused uncharacterized protein